MFEQLWEPWEYLTLLVLNSFLCIGIYVSCDYEFDREGNPTSKMILWWVRHYGEKYLGSTIMMPICTCPTCMASLHSWYVFLAFHYFDLTILPIFVVYVLCLAGMNTIGARFT